MSQPFNGCYCSNYYTQTRCTNTVGKFGERCKLCTVCFPLPRSYMIPYSYLAQIIRDGKSLTPGRLPESTLWLPGQRDEIEPPPKPTSAPGIFSRALSWTTGKK
ncbi:hypothetical protein QBC43DRAFT_291955 [Cladorrhinum sp. PSN259]|nr:hypothetical protein QBC43DRAFT_291955 [Cladorrhinum sp. PSN259]